MMNQTVEQEARAKEFRRMWGPHLEPRHTEACKVLPSREDLLDVLPKGGIAAEIGVAFGDFSQEMLQRMKPRVLHLVDLWENERYQDGFEQTTKKFAEQIDGGSVVIHRGNSRDILQHFDDHSLDFIYIDTTHSYDQTFFELSTAEAKMAIGGLIAGHDFCSGNVVTPVIYGVIQACHRFCRERNWRYKYLTLETGASFSFCLEKISADRN